MKKLRIIGIDPSYVSTGFAILDYFDGKFFLNQLGFLPQSSKLTVAVRVKNFYDFFSQKIQDSDANIFAIETPFLGKNSQVFLKLGYLRAMIYLLSVQHEKKIFEFTPRQVKQSVTGFGDASKDQVARALSMIIPDIKNVNFKNHDVSDALAVSVCAAMNVRLSEK